MTLWRTGVPPASASPLDETLDDLSNFRTVAGVLDAIDDKARHDCDVEFGVLDQVDILERDAVLGEQVLQLLAWLAERSAVERDVRY